MASDLVEKPCCNPGCHPSGGGGFDYKTCGACRSAAYCSKECQKAHWPVHKQLCPGRKERSHWSRKYAHRCADGAVHDGVLELVTWDCTDEDGDELGWGAVYRSEAAELKEVFETKYDGNERKFFKYRPGAFRWTCCGLSGDSMYGCDHHGTGKLPCTCDFCRLGKPLPNSVFNDKSIYRMGLQLPRGPDPRSFSPHVAPMIETMRAILGQEM